MKRLSLRQFNDMLSVVVIVLCLYVLLAPLWPQAAYKLQKDPPLVEAQKNGREVIPKENTLVIPKLKLQQRIHESAVPDWGLAKGVWRDPKTSSPDLGKNTVFTGHRFTYGGPAVFYHLNRLKEGDDITVYWNQKKYSYKVAKVSEVPPWEGRVDNPTKTDQLTIYTCTPLITAKNRLVILAKPMEDMP